MSRYINNHVAPIWEKIGTAYSNVENVRLIVSFIWRNLTLYVVCCSQD